MKIQLNENVLVDRSCHGVGDVLEVNAKVGEDLVKRGLAHAVNTVSSDDDLEKILSGAVTSTRKRRT